MTLGKQDFDGMSPISGLVTPELRAAIEAVLARLAAPGACNPDDETPVVDATPDEDAVRRDTRSAAQRNHDAFLAGLRGLLASGELGSHNGQTEWLPPPHLDHGQPRTNSYHHPERFVHGEGDDDPG